MASSVLIIAESGSGKSTSGRNLPHEETFWINVANKPLPFKGWKTKYPMYDKTKCPDGRMLAISKPAQIVKTMEWISNNRPEIKNLIIDDWQYMSAFEFFDRAQDKGYEKFTEIGQGIAQVAKAPIKLRDDLIIFFMTHAEETTDAKGKRKQKAKTIGKMVDEKLTLEGLFSIVLYGKAKEDKEGKMQYVFETQTDGSNTCKSPMDMFESVDIPNDLQLVKEAIIKYEQ